MAANFSAGTSSCSPDNSAVISGGSTSNRADMNWPTLIIKPPIEMASARNRTAVRRFRALRVRFESLRSPSRPKTTSHQMKPAVTRAKNNTMRQ